MSTQKDSNPETWGDIAITFLGEERIEVEVGTLRNIYNYAEFGFIDQRSKKTK